MATTDLELQSLKEYISEKDKGVNINELLNSKRVKTLRGGGGKRKKRRANLLQDIS